MLTLRGISKTFNPGTSSAKQVLCALDLCGRPYLGWDLPFERERIGQLETEMIREFFYAVSYGAEMNLHLRRLAGFNSHHIAEAAFKAFAKALDEATRRDPRLRLATARAIRWITITVGKA